MWRTGAAAGVEGEDGGQQGAGVPRVLAAQACEGLRAIRLELRPEGGGSGRGQTPDRCGGLPPHPPPSPHPPPPRAPCCH